jgi:hypothetical protein
MGARSPRGCAGRDGDGELSAASRPSGVWRSCDGRFLARKLVARLASIGTPTTRGHGVRTGRACYSSKGRRMRGVGGFGALWIDMVVGAAVARQLFDWPLGAQPTRERLAEPGGVGVGREPSDRGTGVGCGDWVAVERVLVCGPPFGCDRARWRTGGRGLEARGDRVVEAAGWIVARRRTGWRDGEAGAPGLLDLARRPQGA